MPLKCRECGECHTSKNGCDPMRKWEELSSVGSEALKQMVNAADKLKQQYPQITVNIEELFELLMNHFPLDRKGITRVNPNPVMIIDLSETHRVQ
jgi:hypothetical protein